LRQFSIVISSNPIENNEGGYQTENLMFTRDSTEKLCFEVRVLFWLILHVLDQHNRFGILLLEN